MKIDLHTHSTASDGSYSPASLVRRAASLHIEILALTDHDTLDGLSEFFSAGREFGIQTIAGVELSVDCGEGSLHLLGYGFEIDNVDLNQALMDLRVSRDERNEKIIDKLAGLGYNINRSGIEKRARNGVLGRLHIAAELVETGQTGSINEAFSTLLKRGGPAYFSRRRMSLAEASGLIHQAGGVTVWAHPGLHGSNLPVMLDQLEEWHKIGLDGIETDYSAHSMAQRNFFRLVASQFDLIATGGSDFHGSYRPGVELAQGPEGTQVPEDCYYQLRERINENRARRTI